jgi:hypothetical protein
MHRSFALLAGGALLATGLGLAQKPAPRTASAAQVVVYKSPT